MSLRRISVNCPTCNEICKARPTEYEPTLGEFRCSCGTMGTVHLTDDDDAPDGNVHTVPIGQDEPEHKESEDCWCKPDLIGDFKVEGGRRHYLHRKIQ